jgi:hypothetical protein
VKLELSDHRACRASDRSLKPGTRHRMYLST